MWDLSEAQMPTTTTIDRHLDRMVQAEGQRLALLDCIVHLERALLANDFGPAGKVLRCDVLHGIPVPETAIVAVINELRRTAKTLEHERVLLAGATVNVPQGNVSESNRVGDELPLPEARKPATRHLRAAG